MDRWTDEWTDGHFQRIGSQLRWSKLHRIHASSFLSSSYWVIHIHSILDFSPTFSCNVLIWYLFSCNVLIWYLLSLDMIFLMMIIILFLFFLIGEINIHWIIIAKFIQKDVISCEMTCCFRGFNCSSSYEVSAPQQPESLHAIVHELAWLIGENILSRLTQGTTIP